MFEKIKNVEFNILQLQSEVHNQLDDMSKSLNEASVDFNNSLNQFNSLKYQKFVENTIDKNERPHLLEKKREIQRFHEEQRKMYGGADSDSDEEEDDSESSESVTKEQYTESIKVAFDALKISTNAIADDLASLADIDEQDEMNAPKMNRKGLKLPCIYGTKSYNDSPYFGMVEMENQIDDFDGDGLVDVPEGFDDPFEGQDNPFDQTEDQIRLDGND